MRRATLLRLPTGVFYARGVKANVLFFDKRSAIQILRRPPHYGVYDFRTGQRFTSTGDRLTQEHLKDFVRCYRPR
jgi:type I restriction enzyme M protein